MSSIMQELLEQSSFDKLKQGAIVPGVITEIRQHEVAEKIDEIILQPARG